MTVAGRKAQESRDAALAAATALRKALPAMSPSDTVDAMMQMSRMPPGGPLCGWPERLLFRLRYRGKANPRQVPPPPRRRLTHPPTCSLCRVLHF